IAVTAHFLRRNWETVVFLEGISADAAEDWSRQMNAAAGIATAGRRDQSSGRLHLMRHLADLPGPSGDLPCVVIFRGRMEGSRMLSLASRFAGGNALFCALAVDGAGATDETTFAFSSTFPLHVGRSAPA